MLDRTEPSKRLSFARIGTRDQKTDYWCPEEVGVWATDNATGRHYANELIDKMRTDGAPMLLGYVVSAMIAKGKFGGVEVGFFSEISTHIS